MSLVFEEAKGIIIQEAGALLDSIDREEAQRFIDTMEKDWKDRRLFFWARGRSFLVLRGFAMRLMHMGYEVHLVGEPDCPSIRKGDVLVTASGSGSTSSLLLFCEKAKREGAMIASLIGHGGSPLETIADCTVVFHPERCPDSVQLFSSGGGTRFEHALSFFFDACILSLLYDRREEAYREMMLRHANLE
ncbi:MAG TPA: SIS domain-containing protein [Atribacteraceae bacterium]|nr:SIS domain-containing protein [Atribacteraceae bacterium]